MSAVPSEPPFDFADLLTLCGRWGSEWVPTVPAVNALFERLRQLLWSMQHSPRRNSVCDLIALLRQALLGRDGGSGGGSWLRVPLAQGWPSVQDWHGGQFDVLEDGSWLQVRAGPPRLPFLGEQEDLFDDVFFQVAARHPRHVAGDPVLVSCMGLPTYTGDGQREAVRALLHLPAGDTLIVNLPTGSGKSILAQILPLLATDVRLTVAVVPTVALALDQARRMTALLNARHPHEELTPLAYHSGLSVEDSQRVRQAVNTGRQRILFTSPESATGSLRPLLEEAAAAGRLDHMFIDEAHLVVGWGNGFRPAFQLLPALVATLREHAGERPFRVILASATLTATTTQTLRHLFGPPERTYVVAAVHLRPEPRYAFQHVGSHEERVGRVIEVLRFAPRPYILYVTRPDEANEWADRLRSAGFGRLDLFTGKTPAAERERLLARWAANELDGMVATSAFGLGVDKSDVRCVVHATMPESLDRFYQEVGRAGRDGCASASILLYTNQDVWQAKHMAGDRLIRDATGIERWRLLIDHAQADADRPNVYWVDLRRLPPHLAQGSDASQAWNVRTLTLMARAGLIELVALTNRIGFSNAEGTVESAEQVTHAAVRLLDDGHRVAATFTRRMGVARDEVWAASNKGLRAMLDVAARRVEIAKALQAIYSFVETDAWAPVTSCCGGCPQHWSNRQFSVQYSAPLAQRLHRFALRQNVGRLTAKCPMAVPNLLVVDVPDDDRYTAQVTSLVSVLLDTVNPHTISIERGYEEVFRPHAMAAVGRSTVHHAFVDRIDARTEDQLHAGRGEVRVIVWGCNSTTPVPPELWLSAAALEILVIPTALSDPDYPGRRLIDTTPHMHATDLIERLTR